MKKALHYLISKQTTNHSNQNSMVVTLKTNISMEENMVPSNKPMLLQPNDFQKNAKKAHWKIR